MNHPNICRKRIVQLIALLYIATSLGGCATTKIQAPYDSFVCFNKSFSQCMDSAQSGELHDLQVKAFAPAANTTPGIQPDPAANEAHATADGRYTCSYGQVPYKQQLKPDASAAAVFVSPVLISDIAESWLKVNRLRENCKRALVSYDFQAKIVAEQDGVAKTLWAITELSSVLENARYGTGQYPVGGEPINQDIADASGLPISTNRRDALLNRRVDGAQRSETIRIDMKTHAMNEDFRKLIDDANVAIQLELRDLARKLFVLDRATSPENIQMVQPTGYLDGSWVKQGTTFDVNELKK